MKCLKRIWWLLTKAQARIDQLETEVTHLIARTPEPVIKIEALELAEAAVSERLTVYYRDTFDTMLLQELMKRLDSRISKRIADEITSKSEQKINTILQQKLGLTHN